MRTLIRILCVAALTGATALVASCTCGPTPPPPAPAGGTKVAGHTNYTAGANNYDLYATWTMRNDPTQIGNMVWEIEIKQAIVNSPNRQPPPRDIAVVFQLEGDARFSTPNPAPVPLPGLAPAAGPTAAQLPAGAAGATMLTPATGATMWPYDKKFITVFLPADSIPPRVRVVVQPLNPRLADCKISAFVYQTLGGALRPPDLTSPPSISFKAKKQ